jgi:asparagine synthase (glutamine-hydrolysing)
MYRFLACIWDIRNREAASQTAAIVARLRASSGEWRTVVDKSGMIVLCIGADGPTWRTFALAADGGVVLGMLFQNRAGSTASSASAHTFDDQESRTIVQSRGEHLIRRYWGRYVAFLRDSHTQRQCILRDPMGLFPCYSTRIQSVDVYFSWLADAVQAGMPAGRFDPDYVRARLKKRLAYGRRTGLRDVSQVLAGECITHDGEKITRSMLWNPLRECEPVIEDREHAATELRLITKDVVQAWAQQYDAILHALSGGLDSSIVLACLRDASTTITCMNAFSSGVGDERAYARSVAQHVGRELLEHRQAAADVNLQALLRVPPYPEPINCLGWLEHIQGDAQIAQQGGARAIFTGMGGDEIFGRTGAAWAVKDAARRHGIRPALFGRAMDAAWQEQRSVWDVLRTALGGGRWNPRVELGLVDSNGSNISDEDAGEHPAVRDTRLDLPCGKRRHAFLLTPVPPWSLDPTTAPVVERVMPLRSQPLVELCLRVPTYALMEDGWDRALARRAFVSDLPAEVISRRTKGAISQYAFDVLNGNLPFIRDLLLHGRLASEGWIDQAQLASLLSLGRSRDQEPISEVCGYIDIEIWLRACSQATPC